MNFWTLYVIILNRFYVVCFVLWLHCLRKHLSMFIMFCLIVYLFLFFCLFLLQLQDTEMSKCPLYNE